MPSKKRGARRDSKYGWKREMKREWKDDMKCQKYCGWKCGCRHQGGFLGGLWFAGWLFTIGLLKLTFWKAVLAILIWAYYLGVYFAGLAH